ncbi:hypothetical protein [Jeotgalibaca porci]|uniref:hypothetical protein n=1 Tax=Jeotgalibaca porci TaxID=1868793 RepID=UPI00359F24C3
MKKIAKELKWLLVSALIVASAIGLVIGVANLSQWRVDVNMGRVDAGEIQVVEYTSWGK